MLDRLRSALCALPLVALAACASEATPELRLLVQVAPELSEASAIAAQATRSAGQPVRYLAASGGGWHALAMSCRPGAECRQALERLQADVARFPTVQLDERKRIVSPVMAP